VNAATHYRLVETTGHLNRLSSVAEKGFLMPILLTNEDVKKLITPQTAVEVMKETYRSMAEGTGVTRTRARPLARQARRARSSSYELAMELFQLSGPSA
jgi:hypothetical protein